MCLCHAATVEVMLYDLLMDDGLAKPVSIDTMNKVIPLHEVASGVPAHTLNWPFPYVSIFNNFFNSKQLVLTKYHEV